MGAAYYVSVAAEFFSDHGYLRASAGVPRDRLNEVVKAITEEFKRLRDTPVSPDELQRVKDNYVGSLMLGLETSDDLARFYGGQEVARDLFQNERLNLAVIGPIKDGDELRSSLKIE